MLTSAQKQRFWSVFRQILAYAALVLGPLTAALQSIKLPNSVSAAITIFGTVILTLEHSNFSP